MKRLLLSTAVIAVCAPVASAQWFEDFDSYTATTQVVGQGGWEEWSPGSGALVSNAQSRTPANAIDINGPTDLVHQYSGYTSGTWVYTAHQFVPTGMTGTSYMILLNDYAYPSGPYSWSMQLLFNGATGMVSANCGGAAVISMPYVSNQWTEIKVVLDLDQDWVKIYYNGVLFDDPAVPDHATLGGGYQWSLGDFGTNTTGLVNLAAVDLFANSATSVYYDDISLTRQLSWYDDFDAYAPSSQGVGQGGWEEWGPGSGAFVSNAQSRSATNSIAIAGPSDFVHQYSGYTAGKWVYRAWQFIPSTMTGTSYFIMLNTYAYPAGPYNWSVQVAFNSTTGNVEANLGSSPLITTPYVANQWVEIKFVIDLDQNWAKFYYNGIELDDPALANHATLGGGYSWTGGVFGGGTGAVNIAAVDLYANSSTDVYYDDMSLTPFECETYGLGCAGSMPAAHLTCTHPARLGQTMMVTIDNLPASAAFVAIGFDNLNSPLGALPLDLGPFGMPGCKLRTNVDALQGLVGAGNTATQSLFIPNVATLVGLVFHEQALVPDAGAGNALGAVISDAVSIRIVQ